MSPTLARKARIGPGKAQYTLCCNESGGVVDDLIAYLRSDDDVFLIPNAANTATVVAMLQEAAPEGVEVTDLHEDYVVLAVQGPRSDEVLTAMGLPVDHDYMSFDEAQWEGHDITVCRTGYTGERGYELVAPAAAGLELWDALVEAMRVMAGTLKQVVEPTGVLALAGVLTGAVPVARGAKVGVVLSGGNVDLPRFAGLVGGRMEP